MQKDNIRSFVNAIINGDKEAARAAFAPVVAHTTREVLGLQPVTVVKESVAIKYLREMFEDHDSPIRMDGDSVMVDGKQVGHIQIDFADIENGENFDNGGINFIEEGGKFSKEFDDAESMFRFLLQKYSKNGGQQ